jgi:uncharacterized integral membrane protein
MPLLKRIVGWFIVLPLVAAVIALAVANRAPVTLAWNPLEAGNAGHGFEVPLFLVGFFFFAMGAIAGGFVVWNAQRRFRRAARERRDTIRDLEAHVERLKTSDRALPAPTR